MKKTIMLTLLLLSTISMAGQDRGGGDANSAEIRAIKNMFQENGKEFRKNLLKVFKNVPKLPAVGKTTELIQDLAAKGISASIENSAYVLRTSCVDKDGIERSASTTKVDLSFQTRSAYPEICINVRKLALEKANQESIIGLLAHEHARHFGEEDTDELGLHPLADFVAERNKFLTSDLLTEVYPLNGVGITQDAFSSFLIYTAAATRFEVDVVFEKLEGNCKRVYASVPGKEAFSIQPGDRISLSEKTLAFKLKYDDSFVGRITEDIKKKYGAQCKIFFHFENEGAVGKSEYWYLGNWGDPYIKFQIVDQQNNLVDLE